MAVNDPTKFRQIYNLENRLYVEADYENIILIDPNKVVNGGGTIEDRFVQQENLVMYANLETKIIPRTKLAVGDSFDTPVNNTSIASLSSNDEDLNINFLKPKGKNYFDTSWSDDFTGRGSRQGQGTNQNQQYSVVENGISKTKTKVLNYEDTQNLGIKNITVKISSIGVPTVDMLLTDVRGRALFEQGDNSIYSVFFNLPYPTFYLTLKGYYGKAIRYQLTLLSFNAKFDPGTGNFDITLKLMGRNSAILADSILSFAKHSPKMFTTQVQKQGNTSSSTQTGNNKTQLSIENDTVGLQKLREVYSVYKEKKLIDKTFPEITMEEFIYRVNKYEQSIQDKIKQGDFNVINDINTYQTTLNDLRQSIYVNSINDFLDTGRRLVYDGVIYYPYSNDLEDTKKEEARNRTKSKFDELVQKLKQNPSFGESGTYILPSSTKNENSKNKQNTQSGKIDVKVKFDDLLKEIDYNVISNDDFKTTYEINFGRTPSDEELQKFILEFKSFNVTTQTIINSKKEIEQTLPIYYTFGEIPNVVNSFKTDSFLDLVQKMNSDLTTKRNSIEQALTTALSEMIVDSDGGLGFQPTIRNVFAVLFAGLDGFYRMMEDVHTNAWNQRKNPTRLNSILPPQKQNVGVDSLGVVNGSFQLNNENTVYPWPQYFEKERQQDGTELYTIKYPGDANSLSVTQGYNNTIWPEIAFTEEFINASLQKSPPTVPQSTNNPQSNTELMSVNPIEFPFNDTPFLNKTEVNFLYEIFERTYLATHYSNIERGKYKESQIDKILADIDAENIKNSLTNSPSYTLTNILKNFKPTYNQYLEYLKKISTEGTGEFWTNYTNSEYNTGYIKNYFNEYNKIYSIDTLNGVSLSVGGNIQLIDKFKTYLNSTSTEQQYVLDPYPFNNLNWLKNNLEKGDSFLSTQDFYKTQTFSYLNDKKTIARLNQTETLNNINLFVNKFGFTNYNQSYIADQTTNLPVTSRFSLKSFFTTRTQKDQYFTESFVNYGPSYSGNVTSIQTTSLLNTPYFINALQKGVELEKTNNQNPYVSLGYLYLNSLPLITTKEKIKKTENGLEPTDLDYLAATFNKFSSIHQLPYVWVLKYGSIWHRYKKYIDEGIDILDDIWKDFDYTTNYDPITNNITTSYSGNWVGNIVLQSSTLVPNTTNTNDIITMGFYPKVINDVFRCFYKTDLDILQNPSVTNFQNESVENGLVVSNSYTRTFLPGFDLTDPIRQLTIKNYYQFFKTPNGDTDNYLLVPSMGGLNINQAEYECFNDLDKITKEVFNNNALYNGSVRSLWGVSNFGYFDNSLIKKPNYNEYLKTIYTDNTPQTPFELKDSQSTYSKIDEIFAVFEPKILDEFEKLFLNFCNPKDVISDMVLFGEQTQATTDTPGKVKNVGQKKLLYQIESLYLLPKNSVTLTNQEILDGKLLAEAQTKNFMAKVVELLNFDCVLKMGNPGNFNRKTFNYFSSNPNFKPISFSPLPKYISGTLPGDGVLTGPNALLLSQAANGLEWKTLKKYIGDFDQTGIKYTNNGSAITSFFIDNDIEFSVSSIETLYPLIRLYAKEKLKDSTFNKIKFIQLINSFVVEQNTFNSYVLNEIISFLNKNLEEVKVKTNVVNSTTSGNVVKLEYYTTLKTMNDKWIAGSDFKNKTIFEDFLFFDRANRDIGDQFTISVSDLESFLTDPNKNYLDLVSKILEKNNFIFFAMPAYVNFYGIQEAVRQNTPIPVEIPNSMFGTYLDVDYMDSRPKFLCVYVGKPSEHVASEAKFVKFRDDAFDLRKYDNPISTSYGPETDFSKVNRVVGFSVDYGTQNQSIFKSVQLDMSEKKNTAESNKLITQLGESASGNKVAQQTVSLYSIYKTRSYTCTIDCMGDAMIQPTMYFNLRHVPLFYGPYWIMEVNHSISPGKFDTQFKGVRMPLYTLPKPNSLLEAVEKNYVKYYKDLIIQTLKTSETPVVTNLSETISPKTPGAIKGSEPECQKFELEKYNTLPYVDLKTTQITENELFELVSNSSIDAVLKPLYYGIVKTQPLNSIDKNVITSFNYNLYGSGAFNDYTDSILQLVTGKVCATTTIITTPYPYFNFNSYQDSLDFYAGVTQQYVDYINTWVNNSTELTQAKKYAQAYTVFTLFWDQTWYIKDGGGTGFYTTLPKQYIEFKQRYDEKIKPQNKNIYDAYLSYMKKYETAFKKFFN